MPRGLLIDLNDGRPMAITAGLRAPVFSTGVAGGYYGDGNEVSYIDTPGWNGGYESVYIPVETVAAYEVGTDLYPTIAYLTSVNQESGRLRLTSGSTSGRPRRRNLWAGQVWFITPASPVTPGYLFRIPLISPLYPPTPTLEVVYGMATLI